MYFVMISNHADYVTNPDNRNHRITLLGPYLPPQHQAAVHRYPSGQHPLLMDNGSIARFCDSLARMAAEAALNAAIVHATVSDSLPILEATVLDLAQLRAIAARLKQTGTGNPVHDPEPAYARGMLQRLGLDAV